MRAAIILLAGVMLSAHVNASPAINVGALNEFIPGGKNTLAKRIQNSGQSTAFIRITVDEIVYGSSAGPDEIPLDTMAIINAKGTGLLSSPPRMVIAAGGMQTNRLIFTGSRDKERYYRVRYIPVIPSGVQEFGLTPDALARYQDNISAGVMVLTGFGTIVTVQPDAMHFNTQAEGHGPHLSITNGGNSSIVIADLKACNVKDGKCGSTSNVQLRPGSKITRTAEAHQYWQYTLVENDKRTKLTSGQK